MSNTDSIKNHEYLMNTASVIYFLCYIPEFYANWRNKNSNNYNVLEKVVVVVGTSFAFSYAMSIKSQALIINYAPLLTLDIIALFMRSYYAWKNKDRDVRVLENNDVENQIHNPIHNLDSIDEL
jgi:uncharacterized protein with PQ loop repeat